MFARSKNSNGIWVTLTILLVPFFYFLLIGRYGWSDTDDGFLLGFAWRVHNGELPYRDFIYVRPPVSPYLHSIWFDLFPPRFIVAATRLVALWENWIIALLGAFVLCKHCFAYDEMLRKNWLAVALGAFLFSVCGLTPMPWYTNDGIFFALAAASILILRRGALASSFASLALVLAAGTKQSFYPFFFACLAYLLLRRRVRDFWALIISGGVLATSGVLVLRHYGMLQNFASMTSGSLHRRDAVEAGIFMYATSSLHFYKIFFIVTVLVFVACLLLKKRFRVEFFVLTFFASVLLSYFRIWHTHMQWVRMTDGGYVQFLFLLCVVYAIWKIRTGGEKAAGMLDLLLLLGISWCASISWGYKGPILFSAPILVGGYLFLAQFAASKRRLFAYGAAGIVATVLFASLYPYSDLDGRLGDRIDLGAVDSHLSLIVSGEKTVKKLSEFRDLRKRFGGSYVSLPAFGWSYIFANVQNPIAIDWPNKTEISNGEPLLESQVDHGVDYVIVDKTARPPDDWVYVPLVGYVQSHWTLVDDGVWYWVYKNAHAEALPTGPVAGPMSSRGGSAIRNLLNSNGSSVWW